MCVNIVYLFRLDAGLIERGAHASDSPVAVVWRRCNMMGVARHTVADHFGVDFVVAGRHGSRSTEARDAEGGNGRLGSPCDHGVGTAASDKLEGIADVI